MPRGHRGDSYAAPLGMLTNAAHPPGAIHMWKSSVNIESISFQSEVIVALTPHRRWPWLLFLFLLAPPAKATAAATAATTATAAVQRRSVHGLLEQPQRRVQPCMKTIQSKISPSG